MSLLGPRGFEELGELIVQRAHYAAAMLDDIDGVRIVFPAGFFKEFVVNFDDTGKSVADVDRGLRERRIFGGKDLSRDLPALGQSALYCVTEVHTRDDIDRLAGALQEVIAG
jgi:glycine dehydrogenase subunit 1